MMDLSLAFNVLVLTICAIDLSWSAAGRIVGWWQSRPRLSVRGGRSVENDAGFSPQRDDWYVFFHRADLVGSDFLISRTGYSRGE